MEDLLVTIGQFVGAASGFNLENGFGLYDFVTLILRSMGYTGEDWLGFASNAAVTDWLVQLFGPLGTFYQFLISSIDSETFVHIMNFLAGIFVK